MSMYEYKPYDWFYETQYECTKCSSSVASTPGLYLNFIQIILPQNKIIKGTKNNQSVLMINHTASVMSVF
jgi:hypothetical protein